MITVVAIAIACFEAGILLTLLVGTIVYAATTEENTDDN